MYIIKNVLYTENNYPNKIYEVLWIEKIFESIDGAKKYIESLIKDTKIFSYDPEKRLYSNRDYYKDNDKGRIYENYFIVEWPVIKD